MHIVTFSLDNCELVNFPHSLCGIVESVSNLTPRGLLSTFSSTNESMVDTPSPEGKYVENLESLLLSKRQENNTQYKYMLFVWNGKNSSSLVKALAITKGYELDTLLHTANDPLLHILFSGGVIRHKKLQRGTVLVFSDIISNNLTMQSEGSGSGSGRGINTLKKVCETVYLLQLWLPQHLIKGKGEEESKKHVLKYPRFTHTFLALAAKEKVDYFSRFESVDDSLEEVKDPPKTSEAKAKKVEMPKLVFAMHKQPAEERKIIGEETKDKQQAKSEEIDVSPEKQATKKLGLPLQIGTLKTQEDERQELKKNPGLRIDNTNIRDTNRREIENELYTNKCSPIIKDFLYMGSDLVAQHREMLQSYKISHIINCAADYCDNYFPKDFKYKKYFLKDSVQESIESCFYDAIGFIKLAEAEGGRVFIHCIQGVSRSASLCIAYLIFDKQMNHQNAFSIVQKERPIANPNMIFNVQLIWWHMRLYLDYSALPVSPRVYAIGSHQKEDPTFIVARLLMEHLYIKSEGKALDPRSIFVIQTINKVIVWTGNELKGNNGKLFIEVAKKHAGYLQKYEKASNDIEYIKQGAEPSDFWLLWNLKSEPEVKYQQNSDWDVWFEDVEVAEKNKPNEKPLVYTMNKTKLAPSGDDEELQKLREQKPRLYT